MKRNLLALKPKLSKDLAENGKPKDITSVADHPPVLVWGEHDPPVLDGLAKIPGRENKVNLPLLKGD